jgi:diketogulonate reductase-like aldo/keto reductase
MKLQTDASLSLPPLIYGTGSDSDNQEYLTRQAIDVGYTAIDTAPTPAYREDRVAVGIHKALSCPQPTCATSIIRQTKSSPAERYQSIESIPFELDDAPRTQVDKTFARSRERFSDSGCSIKGLLLHAPFSQLNLTMEYWAAMESLVETNQDLQILGICNAKLSTLKAVYQQAKVKPRIVQNSFRGPSSFDRDIIEFCREKSIAYQAYGVLTSNVELLSSKLIGWFAEVHHISEAEALFVIVVAYGRGTIHIVHASRNRDHISADLESMKLVPMVSSTIMDAFEELLDEVSAKSFRELSWSY